MTLPKYALDYRACKAKDLQQFIVDRGGKRPKKAKRFYTRKLRELDGNVTFRFTDLPPELRVMVYRELLPIECITSSACAGQEIHLHPSILSVSKLIHREVEGILYATGTLPICLQMLCNDPQLSGHYDRDKFNSVVSIGRTTENMLPVQDRSGQSRLDWPQYIRRFRQIELHIKFRVYPNGSSSATNRLFHKLNHRMYNLISALSESRENKKLIVHIVLHENLPTFDDNAAFALATLAKAMVGSKLTLHDVPDSVVQALASTASPMVDNERHLANL